MSPLFTSYSFFVTITSFLAWIHCFTTTRPRYHHFYAQWLFRFQQVCPWFHVILPQGFLDTLLVFQQCRCRRFLFLRQPYQPLFLPTSSPLLTGNCGVKPKRTRFFGILEFSFFLNANGFDCDRPYFLDYTLSSMERHWSV